MTPALRKLILTTHIVFSVGWIGAVAAFLVLSIVGLNSQDVELVRGAYLSMNLICLYIIIPLSLAALATGLVQSLGTQWGLFRHYWIVVKLLLTVLSIAVLLMHQFTAMAAAVKLVSGTAAQTSSRPELGEVALVLVRASGLGILVLLVITILSVYKPWGQTLYWRRKQQERRCQSARSPQPAGVSANPDADNETIGNPFPRGLKIFLAAGLGVFALVLLISMHFTGHSFHQGH
jgi:hypothetical protein